MITEDIAAHNGGHFEACLTPWIQESPVQEGQVFHSKWHTKYYTHTNTEVQCDHYDFKRGGHKRRTPKLFVPLFIVCLTKPDEDFCEIETLLH